MPIRQIGQSRAASSDSNNPGDANANDKSRIPFLSILDALGSGRRANSRYDRKSPPANMPRDAFPTIARRPAPATGPFAIYGGRTKLVENGDIGAAFRSLNNVIKQNRVAKDHKEQKFYEKPSNERVRLNSLRHRARFLLGVKRLVNLVKEQRKYL